MADKIEPKCNGWKGAIIAIVIGSVFIAIALDLQFFRILKGWTMKHTILPFLFLGGMGAACIYAGLKCFIAPLTYFSIDHHGVTVYSRRTSRSWNSDQKKWITNQRRGQLQLIPWELVNTISAGRIRQSQRDIPAVTMSIDPSINLDGYSLSGMIATSTGQSVADLAADGLQPMTEAEQSEQSQSHVSIAATLFPGGLENTVKRLRQMQQANLTS